MTVLTATIATESLPTETRANNSRRPAVAVTGNNILVAVVIFMITMLATACNLDSRPHGEYRAVPAYGWSKTLSFAFVPQWGDSSRRHDIEVAIRHRDDYKYQNLSLVVDLIDSTAHVERRNVNFHLSDGNGTRLGAGFGALYQASAVVAQDVDPLSVSKVVVWQAMDNIDRLEGITDVGIIVR